MGELLLACAVQPQRGSCPVAMAADARGQSHFLLRMMEPSQAVQVGISFVGGNHHARKEDSGTRKGRFERGQVAFYRCWRVCPSGNRACSRRETWSAVARASHRDRVEQGPPGGCSATPPKQGKAKQSTREHAERDYERGRTGAKKETSTKRSRSRVETLKKEPRSSVSRTALSAHSKRAGRSR